MFPTTGYVCLFLCAALWVTSSRIKRRVAAKGLPLPPGPAGLPLIGNLFDFPSIHPWLQFTKWMGKYGDIVYLDVAGQGILVLNMIDDVNALLRDKHKIYSDRPTFTMIGDLMGLAQSLPMLPYGKELKEQRKLVHLALNQTAVSKYHVVQEDTTAMYLQSIIDAPKAFMDETRLISGRIILTVTYGIPAKTPDDLYITEAEKTMEMISKYTVPGAHAVDIIPLLRHLPVWLPWNTIHKTGKYGRDLIWSTISRPYERVKLEYSEEKASPSFVKDCLENMGATPTSNGLRPGQDHSLRWAAGSMYGAGGETTYTSVLNFIIAMALYPDQQNKLREELEKVIGFDRLPKVSDRANLPFFNATIKEILRWRPALPLSIARQARYDDFYNGYFIPKGTIVLPNVWAISVDDKSGIPTHEFAPERFLQAPGKTPTDPYSYAFGFGRRECPGKALGDNNLFCLCAGLIFVFQISVAQGSGGRSPKDVSYTSGLVSYPEAFDVAFVCRSPERASIIKERVESIHS